MSTRSSTRRRRHDEVNERGPALSTASASTSSNACSTGAGRADRRLCGSLPRGVPVELYASCRGLKRLDVTTIRTRRVSRCASGRAPARPLTPNLTRRGARVTSADDDIVTAVREIVVMAHAMR